MRNKKDTCFKWHLLGKIYEADLNDIGLMYLIAQIKDDKENLRYELIEEELLDEYIEMEQKWLKLHQEKMKKDNMYKYMFSSINGQRKSSTDNFYREVERRKKRMKELGEEDNLEEIQKSNTIAQNSTQGNSEGTGDSKTNTDTGTPTGTESSKESDLEGEEWITKNIMIYNDEKQELEKWPVEFQKKNENNIPNEEINNFSYDEIIRTMNAGYENYWNKHWKYYLDEEE